MPSVCAPNDWIHFLNDTMKTIEKHYKENIMVAGDLNSTDDSRVRPCLTESSIIHLLIGSFRYYTIKK